MFAIALYLVMISTMVILRGQWVENERLIFPLIQVPLEMVLGEGRSLVNPFFKDVVMWMGFSIPLVVASLDAFDGYFHFLSRELGTEVDVVQLEGHPLREKTLQEGIRWKRSG